MPIATEKLRQAFVAQMACTKRPVTHIGESNSRGPARQLFQMPDGQTVLLRTNNQLAVMSVAAGYDPEDQLPFEAEDFLGIAIPGGSGGVACYLVPSNVAAPAMKAAHRQWQDRHPGSQGDTRVLKFPDGPRDSLAHGFAKHWSQYLLGEISLAELDSGCTRTGAAPPAQVSRLNEVIAESRRRIASEAGRPESAVTITIEY